MRFVLTLVVGCLFSSLLWPGLVSAQSGDCVPPQALDTSGPVIQGIPMPPQEGQLVTSEDRDRFDRDHPDLPQGDIPAPGETSTPEEREAAQHEREAQSQKYPHGRTPELFERHTAAEQHRANELAQQKPCLPQER